VYGGTVCAFAACAAAARMNASCALVEPLAHLGGMTTGGLSGVDLRMPLGGIAREIFGAAPFPNFEPHAMNATLQRLLAEQQEKRAGKRDRKAASAPPAAAGAAALRGASCEEHSI
jgi:hypothetical protein